MLGKKSSPCFDTEIGRYEGPTEMLCHRVHPSMDSLYHEFNLSEATLCKKQTQKLDIERILSLLIFQWNGDRFPSVLNDGFSKSA